jgi:hypothetical protein
MAEEAKEKIENKKSNMIPHHEFMKDPYFKRWYPIWINNSMENYLTIKKEFSEKNRCISTLPRPMNRPAVIIGAGPSLDETAPLLKDWKNPVFTSSSVAFVPKRWGKNPEYICAFDSLWSTYNTNLELDKKNTSWEGSTLLTHPNAEPKMIKSWKWDKYYYRRVFPQHEFFELTFPLMFPWITVGFKFAGNVVNNSLIIASFLGYNPIFLIGVDLGWKDDNKIKATDWRLRKGEWEQQPNVINKSAMKRKEKLLLTAKNGTKSFKNYLNFKGGLLDIYLNDKRNERRIYDCSDGLIEELPKLDFKEVVETQGWGDYGKYNEEEIREKIFNFFKEMRKSSTKEKGSEK